jgi:hypothetical protein
MRLLNKDKTINQSNDRDPKSRYKSHKCKSNNVDKTEDSQNEHSSTEQMLKMCYKKDNVSDLMADMDLNKSSMSNKAESDHLESKSCSRIKDPLDNKDQAAMNIKTSFENGFVFYIHPYAECTGHICSNSTSCIKFFQAIIIAA